MRLSGAVYARIGAGVVVLCAGALACYELVTGGGGAVKGAEGPRPNVLIIMWDTVRADRLSAYGYGRPTTPHLEVFAREAALYETAVAPGIWTLPVHASLFCGLPTTAHGGDAYHKWLDGDMPRLADILARKGYDTYLFSSNPFVSSITNLDKGFATADYVWEGSWAEKTLRHTLAKLDPRDRSNRFSARMNAAGARANAGAVQAVAADLTQSGPVIAEAFGRWLDRRDGSKPFFAFLNYMEAHFPRIPSIEARRQVMRADLIDASFAVNQDHARLMDHMFGRHRFGDRELEIISGVYDASLWDLDAATHELVTKLRDKGLLDETAVFIVSDHGENLGEHGLMEHKYSVYNTLTRVPLVLRYPPRVQAGRIARPVSILDVYATVLDLAGLAGAGGETHSVSLLFEQPDRPARKALISEMLAPAVQALQAASVRHPDFDMHPWMRWFRAVELEGLKFIWSSDGRHELYDLRIDPGEMKNLYRDTPAAAEPLRRALDSWLGSFRHYDHWTDKSEAAPALSPEEIERLNALGYGGGDNDPAGNEPNK